MPAKSSAKSWSSSHASRASPSKPLHVGLSFPESAWSSKIRHCQDPRPFFSVQGSGNLLKTSLADFRRPKRLKKLAARHNFELFLRNIGCRFTPHDLSHSRNLSGCLQKGHQYHPSRSRGHVLTWSTVAEMLLKGLRHHNIGHIMSSSFSRSGDF